MKTKIIVGVVALVVAGGIFFGGVKYGEAHAVTARAGNRGQFTNSQFATMGGRQGQFGGMRGGAGFVMGQVISKDDKSVTVKLQDGGSKIVFTSASTTVLKTTAGSINDLTTGTTISVQGSTNSDGSVTAQSIQIRPAGMMMPANR